VKHSELFPSSGRTGYAARKLQKAIKALTKAGFIIEWEKEGKKGFSQAD
jgi:hypothetical protein